MRPKRQKPNQTPGQKPGQAAGQTLGRKPGNSSRKSRRAGFRSLKSAGRPFERQVDADLTEAIAAAEEENPVSTEFSGTDFPEIDSQVDAPPSITRAVVRERAVRLLVNREHSRYELEQKLLQRELPPDLIDSVLEQLAEEGLQCDARFAESYTRMRVDRGYGANKVRADLQARRLEQSVIEDAIRDNSADWRVVASSALAKKFGGNSMLDTKTRSKMQRYLYQRGFALEEILSAIDSYESAEPDFDSLEY